MATDSKARFLRDAEKFVLQGKIQQAIHEYLKVIKIDPDDVLTMNMLGDLYLREGRIAEASKCFASVAQNYTSNNFLLKAIAVYKKILNSDSNNLETNRVLADLYVRQGLMVEARNQFMRIAEICTREGNSRETVEAYEKVAELDPANSSVRLRLAEIYLAGGSRDKAALCFAGAARAQSRVGDNKAAAQTYRRSLELAPTDVEIMKGYLETVIQLGDIASAINQIRRSLEILPEDVLLREMLGKAYLAAGDLRSAAESFRGLVAQDETQFKNFLALPGAYLAAGDVEEAARCLDPIIPILINRRATDQAVEAYNDILGQIPDHEPTLTRLADIYYATNNQLRYVEVLDQLIDLEMEKGNPAGSIAFIEKILQINPRSEKHIRLHEKAFADAFPDTPYTPPALAAEVPVDAPTGFLLRMGCEGSVDGTFEDSDSRFVEIDLLINYGMKPKALERLQALESQDPGNKDVRTRLLSLYEESRRFRDAAEQCVLLAAIHRRINDEGAAERYMTQAGKLAPEWIGPDFDIAAFADSRGVPIERRKMAARDVLPSQDDVLEIDLSEDISEVFFEGPAGVPLGQESVAATVEPAEVAEEYSPASAPRAPAPESMADKLQEVDFYLRLGFHDEARAKLDEIAAGHPDHPELESRYRQLTESNSQPTQRPQSKEVGAEAQNPEPDADLDAVVNRFVAEYFHAGPSPEQEPPLPSNSRCESYQAGAAMPPAAVEEERKAHVNEMFADVLEEVNTIAESESVREEFDTHFGMGVAYREMNLLEEAIREFEAAASPLDPAKHAREIVQCCGMLSMCFLEKGMARSTLRWCQTGLALADISPHEGMALRYDMGVAYSLTGETDKALQCFGKLFDMDPTYRDVAQRIDSLKSVSQHHGP